MSYTISTDIFCDGEDCAQWVSGPVGPTIDRAGAKKIAARAGWHFKKHAHLCPKCAKTEGRP